VKKEKKVDNTSQKKKTDDTSSKKETDDISPKNEMDISPNKEPEKEIKRKKRNRDTEEIPKKKKYKKEKEKKTKHKRIPVTEEQINDLNEKLKLAFTTSNKEDMIQHLRTLNTFKITVELLKSTQVGKTVRKMKKVSNVSSLATEIIERWEKVVNHYVNASEKKEKDFKNGKKKKKDQDIREQDKKEDDKMEKLNEEKKRE